MSHRATNWAIQQKGLKPATKILLWHLADCHNPSYGCFPSQKYLAEHSEMSERSVRHHLQKLEEIGLIERQKLAAENGFDRTEYTLNFDLIYTPPAKSAATHRQKLPTNLVSNNPVKKHTRKREEDILIFWADTINGSNPIPSSGISSDLAHKLVSKGYVSKQRMRERLDG